MRENETTHRLEGEERIAHYRILAELGQDEVGFFLGAVDERLDRLVVLRVSRPAAELGDVAEEVRSRMREGARVASHLNHPNLVTVYEYMPLPDGALVALEQVEGDTLDQLHSRGERYTVLDVARMIARLADALAAAHAEGIAHGRVGSTNVKVRPDGRVKLLDLGLPREIGDDGHVLRAEPADDVRALAGLACELLAPPGAEAIGWATILSDSARARAAFGFLTPVLARALVATGATGFDSAKDFRDAVLVALESAAGRGGGTGAESRGVEPSFSTRVIGPAGSMADVLPEDGRSLAALGRVPASSGPTRLVLPPDLADRMPADPDESAVAPMPDGAGATGRTQFRWPKMAALATIATVLVLGTVAVLTATRGDSAAEGAGEPAAAGGSTGAVAGPGAGNPALPPATGAGVAPGDSAAEARPADPQAQLPVMTARVRVAPADAVIRQVGQADSSWTDGAEVSVAAGDTLLLEFARVGYVTERVPFTGDRVSVALRPDSVTALFEANVRADVYLATATREVRLTGTGNARRLPSGTYDFVFRSPGQADWRTTVAMTRPGQTYRVSKTDYLTTGGLVATVSGAWAMVSLDGGPERETPATWEQIAVGPHVLRLSQTGFRTIVDTVIVPAGQILRRQYTLQRQP